jgi:arsenate reductase (thioredoxin)
MNDKVYNVLFLCTGNSARSVLAEVQLNALGAGRFKAWSGGSHPRGEINPFTLQLLKQMGLPAEGLRSKSWDEFAASNAPVMDFVFTVCDQAAGEQCPVWPGQPVTAHWGVPDPAAVEGSDDMKKRAFKDAAATLRKRLELFKSLPLASLDRLALKKEVTDIGKSSL